MAVRPTAGSALLFWSEAGNGSAEPLAWHTRCGLARGAGEADARWALTKFKSLPYPSARAPHPSDEAGVGGGAEAWAEPEACDDIFAECSETQTCGT